MACAYITCIVLALILLLYVKRYRHEIHYYFIKYIKPFLTWRILVCYLPFWFIATGWTYPAMFIGGKISVAAITWLGIMWMPWCPEKFITIPCALWLHKKLFPKHSTAVLDEMLEHEREEFRNKFANK